MIRFKVDADQNLICAKASGTVDTAEILDYLARISKEPGFTPGMDEFIDTTLIDDFKVTTGSMHSLLTAYEEIGMDTGGRTAVVASSDLTYGMGRALQSHAENFRLGREVNVFRTLGEVENFLGKKFLFDKDE